MDGYTATVKLESMTPYSQSRPTFEAKQGSETDNELEERIFRERLHCTPDGEVYIPPMAFKNCLSEIASYLSEKIKGKGQSTFTKHFKAGILIADPVMTGWKKDDVPGEWLHLDSQGKKGGGSRVLRKYPYLPTWKGTLVIQVLDEQVHPEVLENYLRKAGQLIGIGRFRPINGGFYGRFSVAEFTHTGYQAPSAKKPKPAKKELALV